MAIARDVGLVWDGNEADGKAAQEASGGTIEKLSTDEMAAFTELSEGVTERWIAEMKDRGIDGANLVEKARTAIAKQQNLH